MHRRSYLSAAGVAVFAGCLGESPSRSGVAVETVVEGLTHPWGLAVGGPTDALFVTERDPGQLRRVDTEANTTTRIDGVPAVDAAGQGGLLDVTWGPDDTWMYLTYAIANDAGETTTRLGRGQLDNGDQLTDFEVLYTAEPYIDSNGHYGSRVAFGPGNYLYMTVGDRQFKNFGPDHVAQDRILGQHSGWKLTARSPQTTPLSTTPRRGMRSTATATGTLRGWMSILKRVRSGKASSASPTATRSIGSTAAATTAGRLPTRAVPTVPVRRSASATTTART